MSRSPWILLLAVAATAASLGAQTPISLAPRDDIEQTRVATRGANFLNIPVGARAQALAGAYTAIAEGIPALYWNSAAIAFHEGTRLGVSVSSLYDLDIRHTFAGIIVPSGINRFAVSVNQLGSGEITRTDEEYPEGGNPQFGETYEWSATAISLHYARLITDRLGVGAAAKYITEGIPGAQASFIAADVGIQFHTGILGTTLAAALVNVGSDGRITGPATRRRVNQATNTANVIDARRSFDFDFATRNIELPTGFRFGVSAEVLGGASSLLAPSPDHSLMAMIDLTDRTDSPLSPTVGFEYSYRKILFLRAGKRWANEDQISYDFGHQAALGAGLAIPIGRRRILVDYAFTSFGELQNVQAVAVEIAL